jgi:membrane associated rhomboid family serine protease
MFPLRALIRLNSFPAVTLALIVVNTFAFLFEQALSPYGYSAIIHHYALIPATIHPSALLTSMFLHGGWFHLIGNMWFLWVFGTRVEDALGAFKYLAYYLLCGIVAALVHLALNLGSPIPTIGASGAIAGVMGGFLLLYPHARIHTLIFIVIFVTTIEVPAVLLLVYWFLLQLLSGLSSFGRISYSDAGGIAWFAHVGGFLAGMLLLTLFGGQSRRSSSYTYRY